MKIDNIITFTKQFNKEFGTKIKISNKDIPLLLNLFHEYIEQTFKATNVYNEILDKIVELEEQLKDTLTDEQQDLFYKWDTYKDQLNQYTSEKSFIYGVCCDKEYTIEKEQETMKKEQIESLYWKYREEMYHKTEELSDLSKKISTEYNKLCITLTKDEKKLLDEMQEEENIKNGIIELQVFEFAFSLATKLFVEGLGKEIR